MPDPKKRINFSKILKTKFLRNILIASILVAIALPIGNIVFIYPSFAKLLSKNTEEEAIRVARHLMSVIITTQTELSSEYLTSQANDKIETILENFNLTKLKIFSQSGEILYSTDRSDIGKINAKSYFHNKVAKGQVFSKVVKKDTRSLEGQKMTAHVVETYVPIVENNNFIGAFEIYYDITTRTERLAQLLFSTTIVLFSLAVFLIGSLVLVLNNAVKNISQREKAEEELREAKEISEAANNAKSEFLATMSHELRTPLNHIIGFTELVADEKVGPLNASQAEYVNDVLESSRHLLALINDILDLSKVEAGKLELEISEVDTKKLLEKSLVMVKERAMKHGLGLSLFINDAPETFNADERKLKQILFNLLSNATKFTPDGGKIRVSARTVERFIGSTPPLEGLDSLRKSANDHERNESSAHKSQRCLEVSVSDTGIGIKPEDQARIFKPFEQARNSTGSNHQGTGLGLSLTKELVELHGGKIWVESACGSHGCTFTFLIPIDQF
ncbi:MAG: hypothetical protein JSW39_23705 [Desulfobacterales bacterium]|nr:MAG: hypothetical protein JSW39_23705 [Desulfobacterales bacterium]